MEEAPFRGGPGRGGAEKGVHFNFLWLRIRGEPGVGVAEEAFGLRFLGGPGKGVAEEDMGAGRRAVEEGRWSCFCI